VGCNNYSGRPTGSGRSSGLDTASGNEWATFSNGCSGCGAKIMMEHLGFILFYLFAIVVLILHFNGTLEEYNLEWLLLVLAVAVFPAVMYL
jgi:hypothetical protein